MEGTGAFCTATAGLPDDLLSYIKQCEREDAAGLREYEAAEAAGFPNHRELPRTPTVNIEFNVSNGLIEGCHLCRSTTNTSRCGGCKVVSYCSQDHQVIDRPAHKAACSKIKKERTRLEAQEITLRAHAGDIDTPPNAFEEGGEGMGRFWGYKGTRPYMTARCILVDAILKINTKHAVEAALEHSLDMLRLNHNDNQGMRSIIPPLYLRLGRDHECYDFLVWWREHGRGDCEHYWGQAEATAKDHDAFEPVVDFLKLSLIDLPHLITLTLLKIRMLVDMRKFRTNPAKGSVHCVSDIIAKDRAVFEEGASVQLSEWLRKLVVSMYVGVHCINQGFWKALLNPGNDLNVGVDWYMMGDRADVQRTLQLCYNAWVETPGAFGVIEELERDADVQRTLRECFET